MLDGAVLPRRVHALEHQKQRALILRVQELEPLLEMNDALLQALLGCILVAKRPGVVRTVPCERSPIAGPDTISIDGHKKNVSVGLAVASARQSYSGPRTVVQIRIAPLMIVWLLIMAAAANVTAAQQSSAARPGLPPPPPALDAQAIADRKKDAEGRRLFSSDAALEFTLTADFSAVNRDRDPKSRKVFPATLTLTHAGAAARSFPLHIRTRGHVRRMPRTCTFAPLRLEFSEAEVKDTVFEGHKNIKLGTHCRDVDLFEQYVPREYSAYRIFNLITPRSFRARLAKATYVDARSKNVLTTRQALFIEDDDDVAKRMEGRIIQTQKLVYGRVNMETLTLMTLLEYMIGNTDWSVYALHNVVLVQLVSGVIHAVPYDFDYSGLVDARYAIPAKDFKLTSVRDRVYRGPCRGAADLEPLLARFRAVKMQVMALFDTIPGMDEGYRRSSQKYLERFYQTIERPNEIKRELVDTCGRQGV
jgi:hypothetical protein